MDVELVNEWTSGLPKLDMHPYRTGAWHPNTREYNVVCCDVEGELPRDLHGVYLRNTENPLLDCIGMYHPFDGDGMLHAMSFENGVAHYRNRFVRTSGLLAEVDAGEPLWAGMLTSPEQSLREGWGARGRMKDASSTDVIVHAGTALTTFWQCGEAYQFDPQSLEQSGPATWHGKFPKDWGISAHARVDVNAGELLFFSYSRHAPHMRYGVVDAAQNVVHFTDIPLPGPRMPHDMAFTENYAILNDLPLFWDPHKLAQGKYRPRFYPDTPSRFCIIPRRGDASRARWFEASPTYVLHFANAYEHGDDVILDGYPQARPMTERRPDDNPLAMFMRSLDLNSMETRLHRWRFNMRTGEVCEERMHDRVCEFPSINNAYRGRDYRYVYQMMGEPNWFLFNGIVKHDLQTGEQQQYQFEPGVFASESPFAPRVGSQSEDDGYILTFVSDTRNDCSACYVFHAQDIARGPIAKVRLPERICSGTHAYFAPGDTLKDHR